MCGISGAYSFSDNGQRYLDKLRPANDTLIKRGPDAGGVWVQHPVALGHRRLSIIDTSCAAAQPMSTPDGRYTIAFNGEIYNYQQLKEQYLTEAERASLRSTSDTEVFLLLFARLGTACFALLDGFFAVAIFDTASGTLTLARDRFGKKPLLIYEDDDKLLFASEMKALFAAGIPKKLNASMLPVYLQLNYVPQPYSLVAGVRKLKPGHFAVIKGREVVEKAYYELKIKPEAYQAYTYEAAQQEAARLMELAVQKRLMSDVPLGAFLSGGIDSSVVVALAARHKKGLQTFSIGYKDNPFFDETHYAQMVADRYQTDHTVFSLSSNDFLEHVHSVLDYLDEPFADSSAIPEYILCYYTRKAVTVSLSGDGGDEVFAGYNKHGAELKMRQGGLLNTLVKAGGPLWKVLPQSRNNKLTNTFRQLNRFATGARLNAADRYWRWAAFQTVAQSMALLHPTLKAKVETGLAGQIRQEFTAGIAGKDFNEVLLADMNLVLVSDMLVKVDMMSMANSLEVRSPFLDQDVVDFAFGLPVAYKMNGQLKKRIVQDAFRKDLPEAIYNRPKRGFEIPLLDWFRKELWSLIDEDLLSDARIREQEIFDPAAIRALKDKLRSGNPGDSHATIWALLVFQHWWQQYMTAG